MSKYTDSELSCIVTGRKGVDLHHVRSRGAGGTDSHWNLMPICHSIHQEIHQIGLYPASRKYPEIHRWLKDKGWQIDIFRKKWIQCIHN